MARKRRGVQDSNPALTVNDPDRGGGGKADGAARENWISARSKVTPPVFRPAVQIAVVNRGTGQRFVTAGYLDAATGQWRFIHPENLQRYGLVPEEYEVLAWSAFATFP